MSSELPVGVCHTCGKPHGGDYLPRHPFNDGTLGANATFGKRLPTGERIPTAEEMAAPVEMAWPFDPVLRQALIDKGVITPDDLTQAEQHIRAVTAQFNKLGGTPV